MLKVGEHDARQLLTLFRAHVTSNAGILAGIPDAHRATYSAAWFWHLGNESIWEQQFPGALIGLPCADAAGKPGRECMRPGVGYRCSPSALPPGRSAEKCHDRVAKAHHFERAAAAARAQGERVPNQPLDAQSNIQMNGYFASNIEDGEAAPLRAGAREKKRKGRPAAQDVDDSCVPPEGPDPPPDGWLWNGCGGVLQGRADVKRAQAYLPACKADGQRLPQYCAMAPDPSSLNAEQLEFYDRIDFATQRGELITGIVYGNAGTGKSVMSRQIAAQLGSKHGIYAVRCGAPTGVAAGILGGKTIHSLFFLVHTGTRDKKKKTKVRKRKDAGGEADADADADADAAADAALDAAAAADAADADADGDTGKGAMNQLASMSEASRILFQEEWEGVSYLLLDEVFMMESEIFDDIQTQYKKYFAWDRSVAWDDSKVFGGKLGVILIGDPQQLPPVCGSALAQSGQGNRGHATYAAILEHGEVAHLTQQMRQNADDGLVSVLSRMKSGRWEDAAAAAADAKYLNDNCGPSSQGHREACYDPRRTHLCATNKEVAAHNFTMHSKVQHDTGQPPPRLRQAKRGKQIQGGVPREFWFQRGAPCLITRNLWVEGGVTNGTPGWFWDIGWDCDGEPQLGVGGSLPLPDVILVLVREGAVGCESFAPAPEGFKIIPVTPIGTFGSVDKYKNTKTTGGQGSKGRHGFGIRAGFACTIHKGQGQTILLVMMHPPPKANVGLDYVGYSRATATKCLKVSEVVTGDRIMRIGFDHVNSVNARTGVVRKHKQKETVLERRRQVDAIITAARTSRARAMKNGLAAFVTRQARARRAAAGRGAPADRPRHVPPAQPPPVAAPHGWVKPTAPWMSREDAAALKGAPSSPETPWQRRQNGKRPKFAHLINGSDGSCGSDGSDVAMMNDFVVPGPSANMSALASHRQAFVAGNLQYVRREFGLFGADDYLLGPAPPPLAAPNARAPGEQRPALAGPGD